MGTDRASFAPITFKRKLLGPLFRLLRHRAGSFVIGGIFALSFDTRSQAALFGWGASDAQRWPRVGTLGLAFTLGMMIVDGANSYLFSRLLRANATTQLSFRRSLGWGVVITSFGIAAWEAAATKAFT